MATLQIDLADRLGYTTKHISLLINGKAPINEETALKLERVLGSTAVVDFAERIGIHPAIVVGRLQHDNLIPLSWMNGFKESFIFHG